MNKGFDQNGRKGCKGCKEQKRAAVKRCKRIKMNMRMNIHIPIHTKTTYARKYTTYIQYIHTDNNVRMTIYLHIDANIRTSIHS